MMKNLIFVLLVMLPGWVFGQQPLRNTYGKYVETTRVRLEGGVFWMVKDSDKNFEYLYKQEVDMTKRQLKCHRKKGKEFAWDGTVPEVCVLLGKDGYSFVSVLPAHRGQTWGIRYIMEPILFRKE